jgi:hypothetical protein
MSPPQTIVSRGAIESGATVGVVGFGRSHGNYMVRVTNTNIVPRHITTISDTFSPPQTIVSREAKELAVDYSQSNYIIGRVTKIVPRLC